MQVTRSGNSNAVCVGAFSFSVFSFILYESQQVKGHMNTALKNTNNEIQRQIYFNHLTKFSYAIVQSCRGTATVQDVQLTSWWHACKQPDSNEIYAHPTQIKHENC